MTVTGRTYRSTRPRGRAPWRPQAKTRVLLEQIGAVLEEYDEHLPLTARQIFYRLVGAFGYEKTENASDRLLETLNRARRAGVVPFSAIRDDGATVDRQGGFSGLANFWQEVRYWALDYERDRLAGQPVAVEVWVEAAGMVPQISRVAHRYGVPVYSSGGFDSVTVKHDAARRFCRRDRPAVVLHLGDHDASGCALIDSLAEDVLAFCADDGRPDIVEFSRLAVMPAQVERYALPTAPPKPTDRRGETMAYTVQAEALAPDQLAREVAAALESILDLDLLAEVRRREESEQAALLEELDRRSAQ